MKKQLAAIQVKGLTKVYPTRVEGSPVYALKKIDLTIQDGEVFGIIGMSGAGKSTLIRCLTGLEKPTQGEVWIKDTEISAQTGKKLAYARRKIGMVFQHFNLFSSRTAWENVLYPLEIAGHPSQERAEQLLEIVGLKSKALLYPSQLSGGEKQRVAIARALANHPEVLLCDEATSALDPQTTQSILDLLADLNRALNLTIVLITHEMDVVKKICHRIAVLEHGTVVEQGKVSDLFAHPTHPTTQKFLQNVVHEVPQSLFAPKEGSELLRLTFRGESAKKPIISKLIRNFDVEVNILLGSIDALKGETIGHLVIELKGKAAERERARFFLDEQGVVAYEL